jgi:CRISPR-associated protein Csd2
MAIENRYEFMYYVACTNANPNGDPDMGNMPRIDPQTMQGFITDGATKRRIRNYVELAHRGEPGMNIMIQQATNLNRIIAEAREAAGVPVAKKVDKDPAKKSEFVHKAREKACSLFYDVRTFGAVMSTGPNAGQVRGPVQISFGKSLDPVLPLDVSITRMADATDVKKGEEQSVENYAAIEKDTSEDKLRTMGRKQLIPFGLYEVRGFVSANLAGETGFDDADLDVLFEAILNMYEHDRSASKGEMAVVSPLIIFQHVGTDSDAAQRVRQAKLGCAPAHKLFDLVRVTKKADVAYPRSYRDYDAAIALDKVPRGVRVGFKPSAFEPVTWDALPEGEDWFCCG